MTTLEKLSAAQGKLERVAVYLRNERRAALKANDAKTFWTLAECVRDVDELHRDVKREFLAARKELIGYRVEDSDVVAA